MYVNDYLYVILILISLHNDVELLFMCLFTLLACIFWWNAYLNILPILNVIFLIIIQEHFTFSRRKYIIKKYKNISYDSVAYIFTSLMMTLKKQNFKVW